MVEKRDNANLSAKLAVRRYFLAKYHSAGQCDVLDCCQGDGIIWRVLRKEFNVTTYWGLDVKTKPGRLKLDSSRVLAQSGWPQNVIDIDTYGSPWKHWEAMLPNLARDTTVFLTIGQLVRGTAGRLPRVVFNSLGMGGLYDKMPAGFHPKLADIAVTSILTARCGNGIIIDEAIEAVSDNRSVRYLGLRLAVK